MLWYKVCYHGGTQYSEAFFWVVKVQGYVLPGSFVGSDDYQVCVSVAPVLVVRTEIVAEISQQCRSTGEVAVMGLRGEGPL